VVDGLKRGRKIFVRLPDPDERTANNLLIEKGAIPVDLNGKEVSKDYQTFMKDQVQVVNESGESIESQILSAVKIHPLTASEILKRLNLDWSAKKLSDFLKQSDQIEVVHNKPLKFRSKGEKVVTQTSLLL
jgi:hypothetical protein